MFINGSPFLVAVHHIYQLNTSPFNLRLSNPKIKMSSTKLLLLILFFIKCGQAEVDLGSMESWGFNGVSSDDVVLMSEKKMKINNLVYSGQGKRFKTYLVQCNIVIFGRL